MPFIPSDADAQDHAAEMMRKLDVIEKTLANRKQPPKQQDRLLSRAVVERIINDPPPSSVFDKIFQS